ncbi:hypothetical protein HFP15_25530 [Amycolatopsis sp. K13G38]|uniref:WXG100 family type VII secretion target n=1 Tax=Amycolatopsis acididurans TaxID=2724524 RepID=A0ABX1JBH0_9PSEU|nr:hypothetical protein [Amycolatopsis acididurans]NKQ56244.1 hypothetical protein [Amycolatopsis acididurans]
MSVMEPITSSNMTSGAGVIDSWKSVASSADELKTAHDGQRAAVGIELGINVASAVLDTVAFALDPLAKLIAAGLGWLIEHVSFLRWPLDQVAGDPDQIKVIAEDLHKIAQDLRNTGKDLDAALEAQVKSWQGPAADAFRTEIKGHRTHVDDAGHAVDIAGYVVETTMALIAAVRALFRDIITTLLGDIISTMLMALALAVISFGASIAAGVTKIVIQAAATVADLVKKLKTVGQFAADVGKRLGELAKLTKGERPTTPGSGNSVHEMDSMGGSHTPVSTGPETRPPSSQSGTGSHGDTDTPPAHTGDTDTPPAKGTHDDASSAHSNQPDEDDVFADWLHADNVLNGPGHQEPPGTPHSETPDTPGTASTHDDAPSTHDDASSTTSHDDASSTGSHPHDEPTDTPETTTGSKPQSALESQNITWLKDKHDTWLKTNFADAHKLAGKAKFIDSWVQTHHPELYPGIKAMADAKSSKNWAGWIDKNVVQIDRQLTDIQTQAEAAWQQSDEQWRQEHPDPAAQENQQDPATKA